jgi:hypothetical protein
MPLSAESKKKIAFALAIWVLKQKQRAPGGSAGSGSSAPAAVAVNVGLHSLRTRSVVQFPSVSKFMSYIEFVVVSDVSVSSLEFGSICDKFESQLAVEKGAGAMAEFVTNSLLNLPEAHDCAVSVTLEAISRSAAGEVRQNCFLGIFTALLEKLKRVILELSADPVAVGNNPDATLRLHDVAFTLLSTAHSIMAGTICSRCRCPS